MKKIVFACLLVLPLSGCIVSTAAHVVTAPVRVGSKVVDWSTTSRSEADRNLGRKVRKERKRQDKEQRREAKRAREQGVQSPY